MFPVGHQYNGLAYNLGTGYISAQAQNPEACYRFLRLLAGHTEIFSTMPARHSVLASLQSENPDVLALYKQVEMLLSDSRTVAFPVSARNPSTVSDVLLQHWLFQAFDSYVLSGGNLESALKDAEGYAKGYLGCTANLPPLSIRSVGKNALTATRAYADCAEKADTRLKAILEQLINQ